MIGKQKLFQLLEKVLAQSKADETEIIFVGDQRGLTRYANSAIHQNVYEANQKICFRTISKKRIGIASTNSLEPADLKRTLDNSLEIALNQPENPYFPGLPKPAKYRSLRTYDKKTAEFTPRDRAMVVKKIIAAASKKGFTAAGAFSSGGGEIAILNSKGVRCYQPVTSASINLIVMSPTSSGYAAGLSRRVDKIDFGKIAATAVAKCDVAQSPQPVEPGDYMVLLEPAAVASLMEWMSYIGFDPKVFHEQTSFLSGKIGQKITSNLISVYDDAYDSSSIAFPFDFEGVPKKKVLLINKGVAKGVVYDSLWAARLKTKSTGHALFPGNNIGALPLNLVVAPGQTPRAKLMEQVKRGILITRFHYINGYIDPPNAVMTGMTRDGTFLIENGKIRCGLKNMRFTDSMMRAFSSAVAVSKETELVESWWSAIGCIKAPSLLLGSFKFTGKTEF